MATNDRSLAGCQGNGCGQDQCQRTGWEFVVDFKCCSCIFWSPQKCVQVPHPLSSHCSWGFPMKQFQHDSIFDLSDLSRHGRPHFLIVFSGAAKRIASATDQCGRVCFHFLVEFKVAPRPHQRIWQFTVYTVIWLQLASCLLFASNPGWKHVAWYGWWVNQLVPGLLWACDSNTENMFAKDTARLWVPDMDRIPYTSRSDFLVLKQVLHVYVLEWSRLYYVDLRSIYPCAGSTSRII